MTKRRGSKEAWSAGFEIRHFENGPNIPTLQQESSLPIDMKDEIKLLYEIWVMWTESIHRHEYWHTKRLLPQIWLFWLLTIVLKVWCQVLLYCKSFLDILESMIAYYGSMFIRMIKDGSSGGSVWTNGLGLMRDNQLVCIGSYSPIRLYLQGCTLYRKL